MSSTGAKLVFFIALVIYTYIGLGHHHPAKQALYSVYIHSLLIGSYKFSKMVYALRFLSMLFESAIHTNANR